MLNALPHIIYLLRYLLYNTVERKRGINLISILLDFLTNTQRLFIQTIKKAFNGFKIVCVKRFKEKYFLLLVFLCCTSTYIFSTYLNIFHMD